MIFFIGIKGAGMASLACMLQEIGYEVTGSDIEKHIFTEEELHIHKIPVLPFGSLIPDNATVIIGNAFKEDFPDVVAARKNKTLTCFRYHEYLGHLMEKYVSVSISGSHGKTTTTSMMASMLKIQDKTAYLIGDGHGHLEKDSKYMVVESCEYRRHFLAYYPDYAIITNVDLDHVDYFKDEADYYRAYEQFSANVKRKVICFGDDPQVRTLNLQQDKLFYGVNEGNDVRAVNIVETTRDMAFDVEYKGKQMGRIHLPFVGRHLLWNALSCITVGLLEGMNLESIEDGLASFKGAARRFVVEEIGANVFIDDYAHHPTEVAITIAAARLRYPDKKLIAIFKPHRVSRVFRFADAFGEALSKADFVALCPFTSIDDKEDGIDIDITYLQDRTPGSIVVDEGESDAKRLAAMQPAVYLFMSSKDIYAFSDLVKRYQKS
jgi:UDP-N-acetylmuramate--alanine ligase